MSHNPERYSKAPEIHLHEYLPKIRKEIGELPEFRQPTREEVETVVDTLYPALLQNEKAKVVDAFMQSEIAAAETADGSISPTLE